MTRQWIAQEPGGLEVFVLQEVDVAPPGPGQVTIEVRAAGVNPADAKHVARGDAADFPRPVGYEVAGVVSAVGDGVDVAVGEEVLAYRIAGGWADAVTVEASSVFVKPPSLTFPEAANLLLAACTAAEMLHVTAASSGETVLVHGASGAVGVSLLQQARLLGVRVIGTASEARFDVVRSFGGEPVAYGEGLEQRVRDLAPDGIAAALDCVGKDEAVDVSLALVGDRSRIVTIAAADRARAEGFRAIAGAIPESQRYRDENRARLVDLAARGDLVVPVARTFPLAAALEAAGVLLDEHPGGKLALVP